MPTPYFIAVSQDFALDGRTNNFSLFHLIEQLQVAQLPIDVPLDVHLYYEFTERERGEPHEVRLRIEAEGGRVVTHSEPIELLSNTPRHRLVLPNLHVARAGELHVRTEVRRRGVEPPAEWSLSPFGWPISVEVRPNAAGLPV